MAELSFKQVSLGHFVLSGQLGFDNVTALREEGQELMAGQSAVSVDLSGVTRSDSAGLSLLLAWWRYAVNQGIALRFIRVPGQLCVMAKVMGIDKILSLEE